MGSRLNLQTQLEAVLGSRNVYFQPPETLKMNYPAIVYELNDIHKFEADNENYLKYRKYFVTLIHSNPDNTVVDSLLDSFDHCDFNRLYKADNLYHYVFEIYY